MTRRNDPRLAVERGTDFVKNGDVWDVVARGEDGSLRLRHAGHRGFLTLPANYVGSHVELGYAATIQRVHGVTVDTARYLIDGAASSCTTAPPAAGSRTGCMW